VCLRQFNLVGLELYDFDTTKTQGSTSYNSFSSGSAAASTVSVDVGSGFRPLQRNLAMLFWSGVGGKMTALTSPGRRCLAG
jgi:hypothetical protein